MARIRTIKPSFFTSEDICKVQPLARLLFQGLWIEADRAGYLADSPFQLKTRILPADECDVDRLLWELVDANLIRRYTAENGRLYIQILTFIEHQRPHPKEPKSAIPHEGSDRKRSAAVIENGRSRQVTGCFPSSPVGREGDLESGVQEGKGTEPPPAPVQTFRPRPLIGKRNLHAEYEHTRFDVPTWWHIEKVKGLAGGESRLLQFYRWLGDRVERTNEDTEPRKEWLNERFKEWLAANKTAAVDANLQQSTNQHEEKLRRIANGEFR